MDVRARAVSAARAASVDVDPKEGVIKFACAHRFGPLPEAAHERARALLAWRRILIRLGLVGKDPGRYGGAGYGNLSARIPPYPGERGRRRFVVTGTQTSVADETVPAGLSVVEGYDAAANQVWSVGPVLPSSESMTHGALYDLSPSIRWVLHGHVAALWRAAGALRLPCTAPDVAYGTPAMAREMARLYRASSLAETRVVVMLGHEDGVMSFGRTAAEAGEALVGALARALALSEEVGR